MQSITFKKEDRVKLKNESDFHGVHRNKIYTISHTNAGAFNNLIAVKEIEHENGFYPSRLQHVI